MKTKETSFINKIISSIKDLEKYPEMAAQPFQNVLKYFLKLILVFVLIATCSSFYKITKNFNSAIDYINYNLPEITFENNELTIASQEKIEIKPSDYIDLIIINTNNIEKEEIDSYIKQIQGQDTGIVFLKDKMYLNIGKGLLQYQYSQIASNYNINTFNKDEIINYFSGTNMLLLNVTIFVTVFITLFIAYLINTIIDIIALALIGHLTSLLLRLRLRFIAIIKITIHAVTLPIILNMLYIIERLIFGFEIKYFEIMYIAVGYIYIVSAILMIKSDLIKRGQELTRIIEEEQRIKEKLQKEELDKKEKNENDKEDEKQKEEQEQEENTENKVRKKRTSKKENGQLENNPKEEPQGDNA